MATIKYNIKSILYVVNFDGFFLSHRLPIAIEAKKRGYNVIVICEDTGKVQQIVDQGFEYIPLPFYRERKTNLLNELKYILFLFKQYKKINPNIIHHISIKPIIYGCIATKLLNGKFSTVNAFSGMGYLFTDSRKLFSEFIFIPLFRYIFNQIKLKIIFQNQDDKNYFIKNKIVNIAQLEQIKGSGVDLKEFTIIPIPTLKNNNLKVLFPARMLRDKGVFEFYFAATLIKAKYPQTQFTLCGDIDKANPSSLSFGQLEHWNNEGIVTWIGYQKDMVDILSKHHLVVLPSYREGLPKSLIEACAIGRPIITTDTVGCRECIDNEQSGFLVPVKNHLKIVEYIEYFILNPNKLSEFGNRSRKKAETEFNIDRVITKTLDIYQELLSKK